MLGSHDIIIWVTHPLLALRMLLHMWLCAPLLGPPPEAMLGMLKPPPPEPVELQGCLLLQAVRLLPAVQIGVLLRAEYLEARIWGAQLLAAYVQTQVSTAGSQCLLN